MASLTATTSQDCQGTQGRILLTAVSDAPGAPDDGQTVDSWSILADDNTDYGGTYDRNLLPLAVGVPAGHYRVRVSATYSDGSTANTGLRTYDVDCSGGNNGGGGGTTPPGGGGSGPTGCTAPNALNYDPSATQDTDPTSCVFVEVVQQVAGLVAAHLPLPVVLRASPTLDGLAAIVVLVLQTAPTTSTPDEQWTTFGRLRAVCDATATARFDLSEAAKSLLTIAPPVENGPDPALSALLRVRYQVLSPATLAVTYEGLVGTCRALNAVVVPVENGLLTSACPYASLPAGKSLWLTAAYYEAGVVSALRNLPANACQPREYVWLNAAGGFDQGFFYGKHVHATGSDGAVSYRDAAGVDRYASRGAVRGTIQVYSDVTDWPTYQLLRGLRQSIQVYERLSGGQYVPVQVSADSFTEYTEITDKTFQVNFTVSYPAQLIQSQ